MIQKKNEKIKNRIPLLRAERGWSQQEVATRVGISRQTVASLEKNRYNPSLILAFEISLLFETTITDVFEYVKEEK